MKPNRPPSIFSEMTLCQALGKKKLAVLIDPDGNDVIIGYWRKKDKDKFLADIRGITGLDVYIDKNIKKIKINID